MRSCFPAYEYIVNFTQITSYKNSQKTEIITLMMALPYLKSSNDSTSSFLWERLAYGCSSPTTSFISQDSPTHSHAGPTTCPFVLPPLFMRRSSPCACPVILSLPLPSFSPRGLSCSLQAELIPLSPLSYFGTSLPFMILPHKNCHIALLILYLYLHIHNKTAPTYTTRRCNS